MRAQVAIDIGGTFTDVVAYEPASGRVQVGKALSTPGDLISGVAAGVQLAGVDDADIQFLVHGSTVVINALIERRGARTALVTTRGFRDIYEIGRINRPDAFNLSFARPRPLIRRRDVYELDERMRSDGQPHRPLSGAEARDLARRLIEGGYTAVAVSFLHSYRNPEHEQEFVRILLEEDPALFVTASHELTREYREYERTSTTVSNAFVGPVVNSYLARLTDAAQQGSSETAVALMQSSGGVADVRTMQRQPVQMLESGPAAGVIGAIELCRVAALGDAIAFDMGGTTAKASVVKDLAFPLADEYFVGGYTRGLPVRVPCVDIVEIGTGGGSIARVDEYGRLLVGPTSAGADPGPACYGNGGADATVTDASVVLGIVAPDGQLSNGLRLDAGASIAVLEALAQPIGLTAIDAAHGVLRIATAAMANAVRGVTTQRGLDPRDFTLIAYGGNGPIHASLVARELGIGRIVIPPHPAHFSALGMLMADLRRDVVRTEIQPLLEESLPALESRYAELEAEALANVAGGGIGTTTLITTRSADMRYVGQEHYLTLPVGSPLPSVEDLRINFHNAHQERFGHSAPNEQVELVTLRVAAIGRRDRPAFERLPIGGARVNAEAIVGERSIHLDHQGPVLSQVYKRGALQAGNVITGPAVVVEAGTSTLLRPGDAATVDQWGNLMIQVGDVSS